MPIQVRPGANAGATRPVPDLSVVVPTAGRPDAIVRLLRALAQQTLPADRFEVLVTDDGTQPPVAPLLAQLDLPYHFECEWQRQAGPGAARNRAIAKARAPILMILNDDAGPPPDLLERHLIAQRSSKAPRAWLGGFDFAPDCSSPFAIAVTRLGVVFPFHLMRRDGPNTGNFFWTCNLSVPRQAVVDVGGFDPDFAKPICEDVELGIRLHRRGVPVHFLADAPCLHHHRVDVDWFKKRQVELGRGMVQLWRKHRDPELLPWIRRAQGDESLLAEAMEREMSARGRQFEPLAREIDALDRTAPRDSRSDPAGLAAAKAIEPKLEKVHADALMLGLLAGLRGWDAPAAWRWLAALPPLTTLFVPARADQEIARRARLFAGAPVELLPLPEQCDPGLSLRETLLARAKGDQLCFVEPGYAGEPQWLAAALRGLGGTACVKPGSFRLVKRAEIEAAAVTR